MYKVKNHINPWRFTIIDKGSQIGTRTSTWNPTQVEARGVNHMEMGTHPLTEDILRDAWDGQIGNPIGSNNPSWRELVAPPAGASL